MANHGVNGQLTIIGPGSAEGFTVEVFEDGLLGERLLGSVDTDAAGNYSVRYGAGIVSRV